MPSIRRMGRALIIAGALGFPTLALAEQPVELCDGDKMKEPTAEKSDLEQTGEKTSKKTEDKSEPKPEARDTDKS